MIEFASSAIGVLGFVALVVGPGAWLSFGLRLNEPAVLPRLAWAVMLSPLVLFAQFYLLAPLELSFGVLTATLAVINSPALLWVARALRGAERIDTGALLGWVALLAVPVACILVPMLLWPQYRLFWSHSWMQSDMVYTIAGGALRPEEPELAGIGLSYPWAGHVYQALLSRSLDSPPMASYGWTNLSFAGAIAIFTAATTSALGGGLRARYAAVIALFFGVNVVGYWLAYLSYHAGFEYGSYLGDWRYTPWLWKFRFFNQMPMALGAFAGIVYLLARREARRLESSELALLAILVLTLGIEYALLLPASFLVVLGWLLFLSPPRFDRPALEWMKPWFGPAAVLAVTGGLSIAHALYVRGDTIGGTGLALADLKRAIRHTTGGTAALAPMLLGLCVVARSMWTQRFSQTGMLLVAGLGSLLLGIALKIPYWSNEYKFVFTAAICLVPFAGLATERALQRVGRGALPMLVVTSLLLAIPLARKVDEKWRGRIQPQPVVEVDHFDIRLASGEALAAATDFIRTQTPRDSVVVADRSDFRLPTLMQRSFYVPPAQEKGHPGGGIVSVDILRFPRAYDPELISRRVADRNALFASDDPKRRRFSLAKLLSLKRPVVILLEPELHASLEAWLEGMPGAESVHRDARYAVWRVDPTPPRVSAPTP